MKITAIVAGLLLSSTVLAASSPRTLGFTRPTTFADGSALTTAQITGYELECISFDPTGSAPSGACSIPTQTLPGGTYQGGTVTLTNVPNEGGNGCFVLRTLAAGQRSNASASDCADFSANLPNPPSNVTIAVVIGVNVAPAFTYTSAGKRQGPVAGFVDVGTPCVGPRIFSYRGKPYRRIEQADVRWWNTTPQTRVAAACQPGQIVNIRLS